MDELVPTTGRVLRYWYGALSARCKQKLYDYFSVQSVAKAADGEPDCTEQWTRSEIWRETEAVHASTIVLDSSDPSLVGLQIPKLRNRVKMHGPTLSGPGPRRRPGAVLGETFECTRARRRRGKSGLSMISLF